MTRRHFSSIVVALSLGVLTALTSVRAGDMKAELDVHKINRLFISHFGYYGYLPGIIAETGSVRFKLPSATKNAGHAGLYSYFVLEGDCEVSATFEWIAVSPPQGGSGVSCGIAVEAIGTRDSLSLAHSHHPEKGLGYSVIDGKKSAAGELAFTTQYFASKAKSGLLALRREKDEIICLAADKPTDPLRELCRMPFTRANLQPVRVFADAGGSLTSVDARIRHLRIRADDIPGGIPAREPSGSWTWWHAVLALIAIGTAAYVVHRRKAQEEGDDDGTNKALGWRLRRPARRRPT
jgi:hypothetical protein